MRTWHSHLLEGRVDRVKDDKDSATADQNVPNQTLFYVKGYGTVELSVNSHMAMELRKYMEKVYNGMGGGGERGGDCLNRDSKR